MELFLIRHGETESNKARRFQGWTESPLSPKGLRQAEKAGLYLAEQGIDRIFCSDLQRAVDTAQAIGDICGLKPAISPLLREIHFGQWEGLTYYEIQAAWGEEIDLWLENPYFRSAPGGETLSQVRERMLSFAEERADGSPEQKRIAAVSHGGSIRAFLHRAVNLEGKGIWDILVDNASISLVRKIGGRYKVSYYNRIEHLAELDLEK